MSQKGVDKVVERVDAVLRRELELIARSLIESGVEPEKVDEAFGTYASTKKYGVRPIRAGEVMLVTDYGPKSHALFGDTKTLENVLKNMPWIRFNRNLVFGKGWVIRDKERTGELRAALKAKGIKVKEISREKYEMSSKKRSAEEDGQKTDKSASVVSEEE